MKIRTLGLDFINLIITTMDIGTRDLLWSYGYCALEYYCTSSICLYDVFCQIL